MQNTASTVTGKTINRPVPFLLGTFLITWLCAGSFSEKPSAPLSITTNRAQEPAVTAPPVEEKPSVRDNFPANGFLWAVLGTALVLMLYFATNIF